MTYLAGYVYICSVSRGKMFLYLIVFIFMVKMTANRNNVDRFCLLCCSITEWSKPISYDQPQVNCNQNFGRHTPIMSCIDGLVSCLSV